MYIYIYIYIYVTKNYPLQELFPRLIMREEVGEDRLSARVATQSICFLFWLRKRLQRATTNLLNDESVIMIA